MRSKGEHDVAYRLEIAAKSLPGVQPLPGTHPHAGSSGFNKRLLADEIARLQNRRRARGSSRLLSRSCIQKCSARLVRRVVL